jgi:hypothetical protein
MAAKLSDKPITKETLEAFIKTQDDFALELYAYSLARDLGFTATHAGSYTDRLTGKTRQFDVRASRSCGQNLHVNIAIECKCLRPSFPLLISQIPRLAVESFQDVLQSRGKMKNGRLYIGPGTSRRNGVCSLYPPNQYVGKALAQVGLNEAGGYVSNDYEVFEKWGQAIASANGLIRQAGTFGYSMDSPSQGSIILPVLVVPDGTLWVVNYAENGSHQDGPSQSDEVKFFIGDAQTFDPNSAAVFTISHLHVVTKSGLDRLLRRFADSGSDVMHLLESAT